MSIIPRPVPVLEQTSTRGWVYIIRADSGHYKIGKSKRPDKRVGEFTLHLPFKVEIVHLIECEDYHAAERMIHAMCWDYHINGEWFSLPEQSLEFFKSWDCIMLEDIEALAASGVDALPGGLKAFPRHVFYILTFGSDAWDAKYGEVMAQ